MTRKSIAIDLDFDLKFWHIIPSININLHSKELEFEWMCIGIYIATLRNHKIKELGEQNQLWSKLPKRKTLFSGSWDYRNEK